MLTNANACAAALGRDPAAEKPRFYERGRRGPPGADPGRNPAGAARAAADVTVLLAEVEDGLVRHAHVGYVSRHQM